MWIVNLLTSFGGRINRKSWWVGAAIVFIASLGGAILLNPAHFDFSNPTPTPPGLPDTIWSLIWLVPSTAITVKRFNDRDWPNWLGYLLGILVAAFSIALYFGFMGDPANIGALELAIFGLLLALGLFALIDNGFLAGTPGSNRYGPSPNATGELAV